MGQRHKCTKNVESKALKRELTPTQKTILDEYASKIDEYQMLLNGSTDELAFQRFFEENPFFLEQKIKSAIPKKSFGGEDYPDFLLILHGPRHIVVEIEKPNVKLFNKRGDPTSALVHAQQQVRNYLAWAIEEKEFLRKRGVPEINADNVSGLLVIGRSRFLTPAEVVRLQNLSAEVHNRYEIKTFDRISEDNQAILENLQKTTGSRK